MNSRNDAFRDDQILGAGETKHVCCGCGGLCDSKAGCPMAYACRCHWWDARIERAAAKQQGQEVAVEGDL